ncbi:nucleolar protein 14-like isoform X2 [Paramacrobiotus metropolitanus]|uniref:nucleolar protein 14-like isoform X2 n=1 Tax=Paramacrobiotus metropolitanus TaxID=2943436 RepID=UPI0024461431|nr:nucleolar protein 14-like isoform X2 [Paramacrobiotus metropolitanus]
MKPKGKRGLADKVQRARRSTRTETTAAPLSNVRRNPFELFLTKAKHVIAGRKTGPVKPAGQMQKGKAHVETQGLRSVSRGTAFQNRKKTLLREYRTHTKNNQLIDRRLGENDVSMSLEDKMMQRVMLERKRSAKSQKNVFNLNNDIDSDEEDGTGFGQRLADVERLEEDDERLSDKGDEVDDILGEKFVTEHHFGGGLLKKKLDSETETRPDLMKVERKLLVDDIIAESKQKKYNKQVELDEVRDMTKSLDEKWRDAEVRKLISASFSQAMPEPPVESYDSLVKKLQFEDKAKASDKLKSDAELAKEARDELEKAEKQRRNKNLPAKSEETNPNIGLQMLDPEFSDDDMEQEDAVEVDEESDVSIEQNQTAAEPLLAEREIPFVISLPKNRQALDSLLENRTADEILVITTRIMKYYHVSLAEGNREKLTKFFKLLLDFILTKSDDDPESAVQLWTCLTSALHELFVISAEKGEEWCRVRIEALLKLASRKKYTWTPSALLFIKFMTICFPGDKHYLLVQSVLNLLLGKGLSKCDGRSPASVLSGLFLATITVEVIQKSKRYFPELIGFLGQAVAQGDEGLKFSGEEIPKFTLLDVLSTESVAEASDTPKIIFTCACLLEKLVPLYADLPSFGEIFQPIVSIFDKINSNEMLPPDFRGKCGKVTELINTCRKPRMPSVFFKKKPAPLKMLEPRIDDKFDKSKSAKKAAIKRLQHDKKRALKSAKRELRRDNEFISRVQMEEQQKKDVTRMKKVKEIFTGLYSQEGEHKALQRQKNKTKSKIKF